MRYLLFILLFSAISCELFSQALNSPESVVLDYSTSYFTPNNIYVSNAANGQILTRPFSGSDYTVFASGLGSVRGLCIHNGVLYGASSQGLVRNNLTTGLSLGTIPIIGAVFLNDVVADSSGYIYLSDSQAHKIFQYNIATEEVVLFMGSNIQSPNGMVFDPSHNRILMVSFRANSPIEAIQLPGGELSLAAETNIGNLDGIGIDANNCIYFSSWQTNSIYRMTSLSATPMQVWTGLSGPADFFITRKTDYFNYDDIIIPNMNNSTVSLYHLPNIIRDFDVLHLHKYPDLGVQWRLYDEINLSGFYVYYSPEGIDDFAQAIFATNDYIIAQNTANTEYGPYHWDVINNFPTQLWWIRIIENDNSEHISGPYQAIWVDNNDQNSTVVVPVVSIYPNPVNDKSVLSFELEKSSGVEISIFDVKGRKISHRELGVLNKGKQEIPISQLGLNQLFMNNGIYLCKMQMGSKSNIKYHPNLQLGITCHSGRKCL